MNGRTHTFHDFPELRISCLPVLFCSHGRSHPLFSDLRLFFGFRSSGAFAIYLEPWHADVFDFLDLRKNTGTEENRARDLFYALWIPDLFMKRVEQDGMWSLFCPAEAPGLQEVYGPEFETLYTKYEQEGRARKTVKAQELWFHILESQTETGTPYMLYKDACNMKSNQKNLGTIKSSNLCTEVRIGPACIALCRVRGHDALTNCYTLDEIPVHPSDARKLFVS